MIFQTMKLCAEKRNEVIAVQPTRPAAIARVEAQSTAKATNSTSPNTWAIWCLWHRYPRRNLRCQILLGHLQEKPPTGRLQLAQLRPAL